MQHLPGPAMLASSGITVHWASRLRMGLSKASTVACATSFSTRRRSPPSTKPAQFWPVGWTTTTPASFAAGLEQKRAGLIPPVASPALCATIPIGLRLPPDKRLWSPHPKCVQDSTAHPAGKIGGRLREGQTSILAYSAEELRPADEIQPDTGH